ncbi:unnamed protein product [Rotaria sp. Silwood1]|nr:unnamed protein product [Rotaria sp. Silwood1]CAF1630752.1 unnamed protein product [Rotaria sp. Silwood1]
MPLGTLYLYMLSIKTKSGILLESRDIGQWSDPKVEPLWITATKQGIKSAVLFWPACHNEFHGIRPLVYSWSYTNTISFREKINNALWYFRELPIQLVLLYHESVKDSSFIVTQSIFFVTSRELDKQGHAWGPDSMEVRKTGMSNIKKIIRPFFEKYINISMIEENIIFGGQFSVTPREGYTQQVIDGLRRIPNVTVYKRHELPKRFHYSKPNHRLGEIFVIPNEGVMILNATTNTFYSKKGHHGWDNILPSMQAIFLARGPSFNKNIQIRSVNMVDIYHIACHILKLVPNPYADAGSLKHLTHIFRSTIPNNKCSSLFTALWPLALFLLPLFYSDFFEYYSMK